MKLYDLIYSFKIENTNDKSTANVVFELDDIKFSTNAKELLDNLKSSCKNIGKKSSIKLTITKKFVVEIKKIEEPLMYHENEELWHIYLNNELVDNKPMYSTSYLNFNQISFVLNEFTDFIELLFNLIENKIFYKYTKNPFESFIAFKTVDSNDYLNYYFVPLENWGENKDLILITEMLLNYLTKDSSVCSCVLEGEPTLAVFNRYLYVREDKLFLGYKPSEYFSEEQISAWNESSNNEFGKISQSVGTIKQIARQLVEQLKPYQEEIVRRWSFLEKQQFTENLSNLEDIIK